MHHLAICLTVFSALLSLAATASFADYSVAFGRVGTTWAFRYWKDGDDGVAHARQTSLANCSRNIGNCKIISSGRNGCVAVAVSENGGYGVSREESLGRALAVAMTNCVNYNPNGCQIKAQFCDRTNGFVEQQATDDDRLAFERAVEAGRLNRAQANANRANNAARANGWANAGAAFIRGMTTNRNRGSGYRAPARAAPRSSGGGTLCPGATVAADASCRPVR